MRILLLAGASASPSATPAFAQQGEDVPRRQPSRTPIDSLVDRRRRAPTMPPPRHRPATPCSTASTRSRPGSSSSKRATPSWSSRPSSTRTRLAVGRDTRGQGGAVHLGADHLRPDRQLHLQAARRDRGRRASPSSSARAATIITTAPASAARASASKAPRSNGGTIASRSISPAMRSTSPTPICNTPRSRRRSSR